MLPTYGTWIWTTAKAKLGYQYQDESTHVFLDTIKEYVLDTVRSRDTIEYGPYSYQRIKESVEGYYSGNRALSNDVNWWLSFDLWRHNFT